MSTRIITGDCRAVLGTLPDQSVYCCVTSPPYFGLRDYGHACQIGLEATPDAYIAEMVSVFREVKRVLRDDGTLWLNIGDSYARAAEKGGSGTGKNLAARGADSYGRAASARVGSSDGAVGRADRPGTRCIGDGLKPKDLIGIPWMLAFALRADGWYLRSDIIWHKPNPMPESVTDRPTKSHEYLFLLSKSERYYYDAEAIAEPVTASTISRMSQDVESQEGSHRVPGKTNGTMKAVGPRFGGAKYGDNGAEEHRTKSGNVYVATLGSKRNARSVWTIATQPFKGAHFATFPPKMIEPCILAGCPRGGVVLDPFGGAGTTALVADRFGRDSILIELNPDYVALTERRFRKDAGLFVYLHETPTP